MRRRRADAERSNAAILDAAAGVLAQRPQASIEEIAKAAGISRQTVYAHFPAREVLLSLDPPIGSGDVARVQQLRPLFKPEIRIIERGSHGSGR